jgi:hypothetical protein
MNFRDENYLYTLHNVAYRGFRTGTAHDGMAIIAGIYFPDVLALRFDATGRPIELLKRPLCKEAQAKGGAGFKPGFHALAEAELESLTKSMGFSSGEIRVKRFSVASHRIRLEDFPEAFGEILREPDRFAAEDVADARSCLERWKEVGQFVFWWSQDYWVDGTGEVVAS